SLLVSDGFQPSKVLPSHSAVKPGSISAPVPRLTEANNAVVIKAHRRPSFMVAHSTGQFVSCKAKAEVGTQCGAPRPYYHQPRPSRRSLPHPMGDGEKQRRCLFPLPPSDGESRGEGPFVLLSRCARAELAMSRSI